MHRKIALCLITTLYCAMAHAASPSAQPSRTSSIGGASSGRYILEIETIADGCSRGNPLYRIRNPSNNGAVNLKICKQTRSGNSYSRLFPNYQMNPGTEIILGCSVEGGQGSQSFSIHWQQLAPLQPPRNVTIAEDVLEVHTTDNRPCSGGRQCAWYISNWHHFKPVSVTYRYRGQRRTETVDRQESLLMVGLSPNPPLVTRAAYRIPYNNFCLSPGDRYPP